MIVDLPGVRDQREALDAVDVAGIVQLRPLMQECTPAVEEPTATTEPTNDRADGAGGLDGEPVDVDRRRSDSVRHRRHRHDNASAGWVPTRAGSADDDQHRRRASRPSPPSRARRPRRSRRSARSGRCPPTRRPPYGPPPPPTDETITELPTSDGRVVRRRPRRARPVGPVRRSVVRPRLSQRRAQPGSKAGSSPPTSRPRDLARSTASRRPASAQQQNCPMGAIAIVLDDVIQSVPTVNDPSYPETISISGAGGGALGETSARSLARCPRSWRLPGPGPNRVGADGVTDARRGLAPRARSSPPSSASSSCSSG